MLWAMKTFRLCDLKTLTLAKAEIVNRVKHLMTDPRSIAALEAAYAFAKGEISEQELKDAARKGGSNQAPQAQAA